MNYRCAAGGVNNASGKGLVMSIRISESLTSEKIIENYDVSVTILDSIGYPMNYDVVVDAESKWGGCSDLDMRINNTLFIHIDEAIPTGTYEPDSLTDRMIVEKLESNGFKRDDSICALLASIRFPRADSSFEWYFNENTNSIHVFTRGYRFNASHRVKTALMMLPLLDDEFSDIITPNASNLLELCCMPHLSATFLQKINWGAINNAFRCVLH